MPQETSEGTPQVTKQVSPPHLVRPIGGPTPYATMQPWQRDTATHESALARYDAASHFRDRSKIESAMGSTFEPTNAEFQMQTPPSVTFEELQANPGQVLDTAAQSPSGITIERDAEVYRLKRVRRRSHRKQQHTLPPDDPFWGLVGIGEGHGDSDRPTDVSTNKHKYIAEAIAAEFEKPKASALPDDTSEMPPSTPSAELPTANPK